VSSTLGKKTFLESKPNLIEKFKTTNTVQVVLFKTFNEN